MTDETRVNFDRDMFGPPDIQPHELNYLEAGQQTHVTKLGCFGAVHEGLCRGIPVAIKKLFKQDLSEKALSDFRREAEICSRLNHPNVVLFMGACTVPGNMAIVTEYCTRGSLEDLLSDKSVTLSLHRKMIIGKEIAAGMAWLHGSEPQIVHRDLKPANILIDKHGVVKVCDFGMSAIKPGHESLEDKGKMKGTPLFMSPESMMGRPVTEKTDVYSYAIVLWKIITQKKVYPDYTNIFQLRKAVCIQKIRPSLSSIPHKNIRKLLKLCWDANPGKRLSFEEILQFIDESILVECAIKDPEGCEFWKEAFGTKEFVLKDEFISAYLTKTKLKPPNEMIECILKLLTSKIDNEVSQEIEVVRIRDFDAFLQRFGPMNGILRRVRETCEKPWFFGDVSQQQAEEFLSRQTEGHFLVRFSSIVGSYTISRVTPSNILSHHRIDHKGEEFSTKSYTDKNKIIRAKGSLDSFVTLCKNDMNLVSPCPGSPYSLIFKNPVTAGSIGYNM